MALEIAVIIPELKFLASHSVSNEQTNKNGKLYQN